MPEVSSDLNFIFSRVQEAAAERGHEYILPEHLLYMLLQNPRVRLLVENIGAEGEDILSDLEAFFERKLEHFDDIETPLESIAFSRVINGAFSRAVSSEKKVMDVIDVFVALLEQDKSHAKYFLNKAGIDRYSAIKEISWGDYSPDNDEIPDDENIDEIYSICLKLINKQNI